MEVLTAHGADFQTVIDNAALVVVGAAEDVGDENVEVVGALGQVVEQFPLLLIGGAACFGIFQIAAGFAPVYPVFLVLLVPVGMALITANTTANATLQLGASPEMRGRVMGLFILVFTGGAPIGAPFIGWLGEIAGPRIAMMVAGLLCLVGTLSAPLLTRVITRRTRRAVPARVSVASSHVS